jgi:hypothetical protein
MTDSHDPWDAARESQRKDVQAIFAKREAAPVQERRREFRLSRRNSMIVLAVIALIGLVAAAIVPAMRDDAANERAAAARKQKRLEAEEFARITKEQIPRFATGPQRRPGESVLGHRARLVTAGAAVIETDAKRRMRLGTVDGPVAGVECAPYPTTETRRAQESDPALRANRYECVAYERKFPLSELEGKARTGIIGVPYWLVLHYESARMAYCRIVPRPGEGGKALAFARVQHACGDPLR